MFIECPGLLETLIRPVGHTNVLASHFFHYWHWCAKHDQTNVLVQTLIMNFSYRLLLASWLAQGSSLWLICNRNSILSIINRIKNTQPSAVNLCCPQTVVIAHHRVWTNWLMQIQLFPTTDSIELCSGPAQGSPVSGRKKERLQNTNTQSISTSKRHQLLSECVKFWWVSHELGTWTQRSVVPKRTCLVTKNPYSKDNHHE